MRKFLALWPLPVAAVWLFAVNVWAVLVALKWLRIEGPPYYLALWCASQGELLWWNWFAGWLVRSVHRFASVDGAIEDFRMQGFPGELRGLEAHARRVLRWLWRWFQDRLHETVTPKSPRIVRLFSWISGKLKVLPRIPAYAGIFVLGGFPALNTVIGIPLCRIVTLPGAFWVLAAGNTLTVIGLDLLARGVGALWRLATG